MLFGCTGNSPSSQLPRSGLVELVAPPQQASTTLYDHMSRRRFRIQASGTTNTYVYCWIAATRALKEAEAQELGSFYSCMMAGVFAAFAVEAFLNHIGRQKIRAWADIERRLGPREKLLLLRQVAHWSVDESRRPFQTLRKMLQLRDALAHGKTETVVSDAVLKRRPKEVNEWPEPKWKRLCTIPSVKRMVNDAEAIIRDLAKQSGSSRDPLCSPGHGSSGVSILED